MMDTSYSQLRQNLKKMIDWTTNNHEPAFITSHKERKAVLISYDDYCSLEETAYLLKSPVNAQRLLQAISDLDNHKNLKKKGLIDE
tara:strand:- start:197 stop:454 length:258 start_codon:yes stop_codon:yes gene_type:complete